VNESSKEIEKSRHDKQSDADLSWKGKSLPPRLTTKDLYRWFSD